MDKMPIIVSYYTLGTPYEEVVKQYLLPSLKEFDLEHDVEGVPHLGSWKQNTDFKPNFIFRKMQEYKKPIVWLDADAQVMQYPERFKYLSTICDMAVHYFKGWQLASGTMYWNWTPKAQEVAEAWIAWVQRYNITWVEQLCLEQLIARGKESKDFIITRLPEEYCYIDKLAVDKNVAPVIYHHQSSRDYRSQL